MCGRRDGEGVCRVVGWDGYRGRGGVVVLIWGGVSGGGDWEGRGVGEECAVVVGGWRGRNGRPS